MTLTLWSLKAGDRCEILAYDEARLDWRSTTLRASGVADDVPCGSVGDSQLPYGSSEYIGLGFFVFKN